MASKSIPLALLEDAQFRRAWIIGGLTGTVRWLEMLSIGVYTFDLTQSPLWVAALMVARMLPMVLFGSIFGAYADRFNRRHFLLFGLTAVACSTTVLLGLALSGSLALWHIAIGAFLSGTYFSTEFPVRRTIVGELAGEGRAGTAMALDSATNNATRALGPLLGGLVYQSIGLEGAYAVGVSTYAVCFFLAYTLRYESRAYGSDVSVFRQIFEGLRYVRGQPTIVGTLLITVIINLFAFPFATMVPVIGRDDMALTPAWVGVLASAEGTGAFIGALFIAWFARPRHYGWLYVIGSVIFLWAIVAFTQIPHFFVAWMSLIVGGLGIAGFAAMQSAILLTYAAPEFRSRVMGVLAVCIGSGPLGVLHLGVLAEWFGARTAVSIIALEGLWALGLTALLWGRMLRRR